MPTISPRHVSTRGVRFAAAVGAVLMGLALFLGPTFGLPFVAIQTLVFAIGAIMGLSAQPYFAAYRRWIRPRQASRSKYIPEPPVRFTEALGMLLGVSAMIAGTLSAQWWFYITAGLVFAALFLQAAAQLCLGCLAYQKVADAVRTLPAEQVTTREDSNV